MWATAHQLAGWRGAEPYPRPMYAQFFGLTRLPFSIAPDPRFLFMSERHREALAHLLYGLQGGGGVVLLSGEIGAGKTTVCRCFLEQLPAHCNVAYILNPRLTVPELLQSICDEFHIAVRAAGAGVGTSLATVKDYLDPLNAFLLRTHALGQNNLLVIDEAQALSADVLEQLRLLTNLETNERKLLQIVLIGQPELRQLLARPELEQLAQRVIARFHLEALSALETAQYIAHRLAVAGRSGAAPFDVRALRRIHQCSRGVPRRINLLCDRALLGAYASGRTVVDRAIVERASAEVFGSRADRNALREPRVLRSAVLGGVTVLGALLFGVGVYGLVEPFSDSARAPVRATAPGGSKVALAVAVAAPVPAREQALREWRTPADDVAPLGPGASGARVDWLGEQLSGFDTQPAPPPGQTFDAALKARVRAFQLAHGLRPDGWVGPTTFRQLNRIRGVAASTQAAAPTPAPAPIPVAPSLRSRP